MGHDHNHHHYSSGNLKTVFFLNLAFTIFEIFGGIFTNSVAIISDAIHDLGDSLSLGTAWYLDVKSKSKANKTFSYGYARFSLLGALINCLVLIIGSIYVICEATGRLMAPEETNAEGMLLFSLVGIAVNGYAAWKVSGGSTLNEKMVSWHLMEDVLGWVAILVASIILLFWEAPYLDPALSLGITLYILWNVIQRLKETLFIFLQGVPKDIHLETIEQEIVQVSEVDAVHHTHIWSLDGEHYVFTTHINTKGKPSSEAAIVIKNKVRAILDQYPFVHSTIEIEVEGEECGIIVDQH